MEDVDSFRARARAWLAEHMPRKATAGEDIDRVARHRELQARLTDGGFAGITFPLEYGGLGLSSAHVRAFNEEAAPYETPYLFGVTFGILAPTLLEFGTEQQKQRHIPAMLRGEEFWVQFLSEPTGGSDLAGAMTRATRDGDTWVLNGSKVWSTGAHYSDYAMCLARTDWDVPKHRGLTMFIVPIRSPGITVEQIRLASGGAEFCQEFLDDVVVPADGVVGEVNDGWTVASRLLVHERNAVGGVDSSLAGYSTTRQRNLVFDLIELARRRGLADDAHVRQLVAGAYVDATVQSHLVARATTGFRTGAFPGPAGALLKLYVATLGVRRSDITMEIAGSASVGWTDDDADTGRRGELFIGRQGGAIAGGTNEMQRNVIAERVLGLPREQTVDRDVPFSQVLKNRSPLPRRNSS